MNANDNDVLSKWYEEDVAKNDVNGITARQK